MVWDKKLLKDVPDLEVCEDGERQKVIGEWELFVWRENG